MISNSSQLRLPQNPFQVSDVFLAAQLASGGRKPGWKRVQGETSTVSPCVNFGHEKPRDGAIPPLGEGIIRPFSWGS